MGRGKLANTESGVHSGTAADSLLWDRTDSALCLSFPISKAEIKVPDLPKAGGVNQRFLVRGVLSWLFLCQTPGNFRFRHRRVGHSRPFYLRILFIDHRQP